MFKIHRLLALLVASLLTACASIPSEPSFMALPGSGKDFDQFRNDDYQCRQLALEQVTADGANGNSNRNSQQRYDSSYIQCMYAKNHRVPVYGQFTNGSSKTENSDQNTSIPPPPSGSPPPPPPN